MKPVSIEDLRMLAGAHPAPCVSLLMPTHKTVHGGEQDPIRFHNLLKKADGLLQGMLSSKQLRALLKPLEDMDTTEFWRHQTGGLAVYRAEDLAVYYRVPTELPELVTVSDSFQIKPLLSFLQSNRNYYVLSLSQKGVALYQGDAVSLTQRRPTGLPSSIQDALGAEWKRRVLNPHSANRGGEAQVFHGQGAPGDDKKEDLLRFFRVVDRALWDFLRDSDAPLFLAGVGYYHTLYRSVTRYRRVAEEGVEGNFEHASAEDMHGRVWPLASALFARREAEALEEYGRHLKLDRATDDLGRIGRAAVQGRVRRLLLADGQRLWGRLDHESGAVELRAEGQDHDDDVLDDLAEAVLIRGGDVLVVGQDRLPSNKPLVATFRW